MHFHRADSGTSWPKVPIGSWRLWDAYTAWPNLEPEPGKWDFKRLDAYVIKAKLTGTGLLLPLGLSPAWASARPDEKSGYGAGQAAEPRDIEDWKRYVRTVAMRYKGKIRDYEIWNEVNIPGFYSGSVETMVMLTRETYRILKEIDPENRLVSPSVVGSSYDVSPWLEEFLQKGGGQYVDVIGYHFYAPKGQPELMLPLIRKVRSIMLKHGVDDKPLWNTETGWLIRNDEQEFASGSYDKTWVILDQDNAAAYLARAFIISWAAGVERFYWYAWDSGVMGLIEPKSKRDKAVVRGYAALVRWLEGARNLECLKQAETWECSLIGRDGANEHIVWAESDSDIVYSIPFDWKVEKIESLDGAQRFIHQGDSEQIMLSGQPMRLITRM
ncbi:MAG: glycosyl hydrolase [Methylomonas sp.]